MKNIKTKLLLTLASLFTFSSCNEATSILSIVDSGLSTSTTTETTSTPDVQDYSKGVSGVNPTEYEQGFVDYCVGQLEECIPFCPCIGYSYEFTEDLYHDPFLSMYFSFIAEATAEKAYDYYAYLCQEAGYSVESGYYNVGEYYYLCYYADKIVSEHTGIEIIIMEAVFNEVPTVAAFAYTYLYEDENIYPQIAVDKLLGYSLGTMVPQVTGDGYTYSFKFYAEDISEDGSGYSVYYDLMIVCYDAGVEEEEWFFNQLLEKGFYIWAEADLEDDEAPPMSEYGEYTGEAYCAYTLGFGIYFYYSVMYGAFIFEIFVYE